MSHIEDPHSRSSDGCAWVVGEPGSGSSWHFCNAPRIGLSGHCADYCTEHRARMFASQSVVRFRDAMEKHWADPEAKARHLASLRKMQSTRVLKGGVE